MTINMAVLVLAAIWIAGEVVLQTAGWLRGGVGRAREWSSLVVLAVAGVVAGLISGPVATALPWPGRSVPLELVGLAVAAAGVVLRLWSIVALGRFFRGVVTILDEHAVVRRGPYRILRHPSYAGALVGVAGFGLVGGSLAGIAATLLVVGVGLLYRIRSEERMLLAALGRDYADYAATTARLIPRVW